MKFENKVVLITGGSRGIGKEVARLFADEGASVVITYLQNTSAAENVISSLSGKNHSCIQSDIADPEEVSNLVSEVVNKYGRIDILVNNAGIAVDHPIENMDYETWQNVWERTINTNLVGLANLSFLVAKQMIKQMSGHIINVSSRGAFRGEPENLAYGASKGGLNSFSQSLAKSLGKYNISVTAVAPGFVETDMGMEYLNSERGDFLRNESPFKRVAKPEEVALTIIFLANENSKFLTGGIVDINGASFLRM